MHILQAILLGVVQGLTEFLPVSSSGHLVIFQEVFGLGAGSEDLLLEVLLHLGTLLAVLIAFRRDVWLLLTEAARLAGGLFRGRFGWRTMPPHRRLVVLLVLATLPLLPVALLGDALSAVYNSLWAVGVCLLVTGALLWLSVKLGSRRRQLPEVRPLDALLVGCFQAVAVLPGVSRSGATIVGGLLRGFDRELAVKFSFLLSIPAILGANVLEISDALAGGFDTALLLPYACGVAAALVSGLAAIKLLQLIMRRNFFGLFGWYCGAVGLFCIVWHFIF